MSLESFYGGKQGLSSVIKKAFKYISENDPYFKNLTQQQQLDALANEEVMESCFQKLSFEDVWYGELCIIDTDNKNNPANGCLFRRTLCGQGSEYPIQIYRLVDATEIGSNLGKLSAEYIGQIVGPKSGLPYVNVGNLEMVTDEAKKDRPSGSSVAYQRTVDGTDEGYVMTYRPLGLGETVYEHNATEENVFIHGKETDEIKYTWVNVRNNTKDDEESWMYLGFQIPYLEIDWSFRNTDFFVTPTETNRATDRLFYQDWLIDIPLGVRGNAASKIKLTTLENTPLVYRDFTQVIKQSSSQEDTYFYINEDADKVNEAFIKQENNYSQTIDDNFDYTKVPFFVYEYTIYNDFNHQGTAAGDSVYIYMGRKKDIKNFTLALNGVVTAHYDNLTKQQVNPTSPIIWIDDITIVPSSAAIEDNPGQITIRYNNSVAKPDYSINLGLVRGASYDAGTGKFTFTRTDGTSFIAEGPAIEYPHTIELIGDIADDGSDESADRDIKVTSNLEDAEPVSLGSPINYIQDIIVTKDMHLCVLFNDKNKRTPKTANLNSWTPGGPTSSGQADENGNYWRIGLTGSNNVNYGNLVYWRDYGRTTEYHSGLLFGYHLELIRQENGTYLCTFTDSENIEHTVVINSGDKAAIINEILQVKWPNGLPVLESPVFEGDLTIPGNEGYLDLRGMLVTAVMKDDRAVNITYYFGYDYDKKVWECIQESASANQVDAVIADDELTYVFSPSNEGVTFNINEVEDIKMQGTLPAPWLINGSYEVADDPEPEPTPEPEPAPEPEPEPDSDNSGEESNDTP